MRKKPSWYIEPYSDEFDWEEFYAYLGGLLRIKFPNEAFKVEIHNFGWNRAEAKLYVSYNRVDDPIRRGEDILRKLLPDCDCSVEVFEYYGKIILEVKTHDNPVNPIVYTLTTCAYSTYLRNRTH